MLRRKFLLLLMLTPLFVAPSVCAQTDNHPSLQSRKWDEYGDVRSNDAKARLDMFATDLHTTPDAQGYIIGYGGRRCPNTAQAQVNLARSYLVGNRGLDAARLVVINGGRRSDANTYKVELWIVPRGATPPRPSPTLTRRCR